MAEEQETPVKSSVLTKKRFEEIMELLNRECDASNLERIKTEFLRIMCYDPTKKQYNAEKGKHMMASRRKRVQELGMTMWEYNGGKKAYEKKKAAALQQTQEA